MIQEQAGANVLVTQLKLIIDNARWVLNERDVPRKFTSVEVFKTMSGGTKTLDDLTADERLLFEKLFDAESGFMLKIHPALPDDWTFLWVNAHEAEDAQDLVVKLAEAMRRIGFALEAAKLLATATLQTRQKGVAAHRIAHCSDCLKTFALFRLPSSTGMLLASHYACLAGVAFKPEGGPERMTWVPPRQPYAPRNAPGDNALLADCGSIREMHERIEQLVAAFKLCCIEGNQEEAQLILDRLHSLSMTDPYKSAAMAYFICGKHLAWIASANELTARGERLKQLGIKLHCSVEMEIVFERESQEALGTPELDAILDYVASVLANPHPGTLASAYFKWLDERLALSPEQRAPWRRMVIDYGLAHPKIGLLSVLLCAKSFGSVAPTQDERESLASLMVTLATPENFAALANCTPIFHGLLPAEQGKDLHAYLTARLIRDGKFDQAQRLSMLCVFLESNPAASPGTEEEIRLYCELFGCVLSAERGDISNLYFDFLSRAAAHGSEELRRLLALSGQLSGLAAFARTLEALLANSTNSQRKQHARLSMRNNSALKISNSPHRYLAKEFLLSWSAMKCTDGADLVEAELLIAMLKELAIPNGFDLPLQLLMDGLILSSIGDRIWLIPLINRRVQSWFICCGGPLKTHQDLYWALGHFTDDEHGGWPGTFIRQLQLKFQIDLAIGAYGAATRYALGLAATLVEYCSAFPSPDLNERGNRSREEWIEVLRTFEDAVIAPLRECAPRGSPGLVSDAELEALGASIGALSRWVR